MESQEALEEATPPEDRECREAVVEAISKKEKKNTKTMDQPEEADHTEDQEVEDRTLTTLGMKMKEKIVTKLELEVPEEDVVKEEHSTLVEPEEATETIKELSTITNMMQTHPKTARDSPNKKSISWTKWPASSKIN